MNGIPSTETMKSGAGRYAKDSALTSAIIFSLFFLFADFGFFSELDGFFYVILALIARPRLAPYFLVMVATIQDAAGLSYDWWYGTFLIVGIPIIVYRIAKASQRTCMTSTMSKGFASARLLLVLAGVVIVYGVLNSELNALLGGAMQSARRPPLAVGALMLFMASVGYAAAATIFEDPAGLVRFRTALLLAITNGVAIALAQLVIGPSAFASHLGRSVIDASAQLDVATTLGFPRITSTYITPNGFALGTALLLLLWLPLRKNATVGRQFVLAFGGVGVLVSVLALSKAMLTYFVVALFFLLAAAIGTSATLIFAVLALAATAIALWNLPVGAQALEVALRVPSSGGLGYRSEAWGAVLAHFTATDWIFGTGLSHWPKFFNEAMGVPLADPHTYILSIPGTFGFVGALFYAWVFALLLKSLRKRGQERPLVLCLLLLFFGKDLVSIPYILGNTPLTFLIWLLLTMSLTRVWSSSDMGLRGGIYYAVPGGKPWPFH